MAYSATNNFAEQRLDEEREVDNAGNKAPLKRVSRATLSQDNYLNLLSQIEIVKHSAAAFGFLYAVDVIMENLAYQASSD